MNFSRDQLTLVIYRFSVLKGMINSPYLSVWIEICYDRDHRINPTLTKWPKNSKSDKNLLPRKATLNNQNPIWGWLGSYLLKWIGETFFLFPMGSQWNFRTPKNREWCGLLWGSYKWCHKTSVLELSYVFTKICGEIAWQTSSTSGIPEKTSALWIVWWFFAIYIRIYSPPKVWL